MSGGVGTRRAWVWTNSLCGVIPPLITPLDRSGQVDVLAIRRLVEYLVTGGCSGLFVVGGCGMGAWLTSTQRGETISAMVDAAAARVPVLAGVMLPSTGLAIEAARQAEALGVDALVVGSPYYYEASGDAQRRHVEAVLRATTVPVLLYNIPQCTHHPILPETVATLAQDPRILGIKDSSGNLQNFQGLVALKSVRPDLRVLQGDERVMAASLLAGGDGMIPGLGNLAPRFFVALLQAAARGDVQECREIQRRIADLWTLFAHGEGLSALYAACATLGMGSGTVLEPWVTPDVGHRDAIAEILRRHALISAVPV